MYKVLSNLVESLYNRVSSLKDSKRGTFMVKGDTLFIKLSQTNEIYKISFWGDDIDEICLVDENYKTIREQDSLKVTPTSIFVTPKGTDEIFEQIEQDLKKEVLAFKNKGLILEANRLEDRTKKDIELMREMGWTQGIENYSSYFEQRLQGERSKCLLDYFPLDDYMIMLDESHVTLPQLKGMYKGAVSTKRNLVEYGFRLSAALNNRPLTYNEFDSITDKILYVSATPSDFELNECKGLITELLVRPTGILDPKIIVKPTEYCIDDLLEEINITIENNMRIIVTTISKKQAEDLSSYLLKMNIKSKYLHGDIETLDRINILHQLRTGKIDVIVGINLLREGLDLPEVGLVAILDADKEGFLRNYTSMSQVIGRAARNVNGKAIMYADKMTISINKTIKQNIYNRKIQEKYNIDNNIIPRQIKKNLNDISIELNEKKEEKDFLKEELYLDDKTIEELKIIHSDMKRMMTECSKSLDFIDAALYRDLMYKVENEIDKNNI